MGHKRRMAADGAGIRSCLTSSKEIGTSRSAVSLILICFADVCTMKILASLARPSDGFSSPWRRVDANQGNESNVSIES